MSYRIGQGTDYHVLEVGREFWLGGVHIPHTKGALGHSDADVLLHAICDALLGALALGDIGFHFPNTDNKYKDIDSKILLKETYHLIQEKGYQFVNVDSTILLENPKIMPYILPMRETIASVLGSDIAAISIKATTTEKLGFVGEEKGIVAHASVLIKKIE